MGNKSTILTIVVNASRERIYEAMVNPSSISQWMVPNSMTMTIHEFSGHVGGKFRISLTYDSTEAAGKTSAHVDTYLGRFIELLPDEKVVEAVEFETTDPLLQGEMTISFTLSDKDGGTEILAVQDHLPPGLSPVDNETGWRMSLSKLAALVEANPNTNDG